ncbi:clathrin adaptor, mu subunit [Piromyces finnis]|uniref:Coatomer subunit delta n=1 Tax=Piromyces finnis TaxID=1754191 RepID=A0A1Y1VKM9_9FUNG|nr:clathrin adaptor, mu subunit [Piromyces finnis]|eukprot:ORX57350.1 clathrin adaptor, mu subunit [Piromyces finnis]
MVVISASVCTKTGKAILSRQFMDMSRSRIEGLLASFPKLIDNNEQHTFVETDSVRYVYQPLEELFMVLITNKNSNILQDIETLNLFVRAISDYCHNINTHEIEEMAFELSSVFDEIVNLGYREYVSIQQLRTISEMESHEEKLAAEIEKNKEKEAKELLNRKAKSLEMQRKEMQKKMASGGMGMGYGSGGFGNNGGYGNSSGYGNNNNYGNNGGFGNNGGYGNNDGYNNNNGYGNNGNYGNNGGYGGFGNNSGYNNNMNQNNYNSNNNNQQQNQPFRGKGMQLGHKNNNNVNDLVSQMQEEVSNQAIAEQMASASNEPSTPTEPVHAIISEKISLAATHDGGLENLEIKGDMILRISDPNSTRLRIQLNNSFNRNFQFKTHPQVDKKLFNSDSVIALKDPSKPFPIGSPLGILKWRFATRDESFIPLSINCWPSLAANGTCDVNIEYELEVPNITLNNVSIIIPYPGMGNPTVGEVDGSYNINHQNRYIEWQIPIIDADNRSGSMEFNVPGNDTNAFFPVRVNFTSQQSFSNINIADIQLVEDGTSVSYSNETRLMPENYIIM